MIWYIVMAAVFTLAGIGAKWTVDRLFGKELQILVPPRHAAPESRRVLEFDDTMDVLGAGVDVGKKIAQDSPHVSPRPEVPLADYMPPAEPASEDPAPLPHNDDALGLVSGAGPVTTSGQYPDPYAHPYVSST